MLEITLRPARQGDALWVRWGDPDDPHHILIDMGTMEIGEHVRQAILDLPEDKRRIDLLVVTHVDRDHIGGVLTCLAEADPIPGLTIGDIWFNGRTHLEGKSIRSSLRPMGAADGERLSTWLRRNKWNDAFDGGPVQRVPGKPLVTIPMHDGLTLTVLGPTPARLEAFIGTWDKEVAEAIRKGRLEETSGGLVAMGSATPPELFSKQDLIALADTRTENDDSGANGSSIALLLRYRGKSILLTGDAFAEDLIDGIDALGGNGRLTLDAFKLPHHGSQGNVTRALVERVDCPRWLISTDGTQFKHPDAVAIARIVAYSAVRPPRLLFNVPSKFNGWWKKEAWRRVFAYEEPIYGSADRGLTLPFEV